jgi:aspartate/methionine/tyrosine aminotransferase
MQTAGAMTDGDWTRFESRAQENLNDNRTEFSKLEKFFGHTPINKYGMFYYAPIDAACHKLLTRSGIIWSPGSDLGATNDFGRFNVGQDMAMTKEAVQTILKNDKI